FVQLWSILGQLLDRNDVSMFRQIMPAFWLLLKSVTPIDADKDLNLLKTAIEEHHSNQYIYDLTKKYSFRDDSLPDGTTPDQFSIFNHKKEIEKLNIPILAWCAWLDSGYVDAIINRFLNIDNPMIAILGDWNHGARTPANQFFPSRPRVSPTPEERHTAWIGFFNQCLKGGGIKGKTLYYYTMVEEKWKKTNVWPPNGHAMQRWYLTENNGLSTTIPQDKDGEDNYKINFRATTGNLNRWYTLLSFPISYPNRAEEDKKLLTYTSAPIKEDIEITGNPIINLYLTSTDEDGAIFAYLEEVDEKGNVTYICDGQFRVIHRKISSEKPPYKMMIPYHSFLRKDAMPLVPGEIAEIKFGLYATSVVIRKGHSIRIAIAGADKDTFLRYPAKGKPTITIARNKTNPSYIDLPVIRK
ncbi:MAG: CocE/NonD family hydrolase, partial [Promethearchaeota archaeon]